VLLLAGLHDNMIPPAGAERLAAILSQAGADLTLEWRDTGHSLTKEDFLLAAAWLGKNFP
jgi:predicted esterase